MLNACTIIACNYLPFATVLAESFLAHHPDGRFTVLLVDDERREFTSGPAAMTAHVAEARRHRARPGRDPRAWPASTTSPSSPRRSSRCSSATCSTTAATEVIYLDPDIRIFDSLKPVADLAASHGIVLTPHTTRPFPTDDREIDGFFVLAAGVYNLGFIAVGGAARPVPRLVVAAHAA